MKRDIRLDVGFHDHPKTIKLQRLLGWEAVICLQRLWLYAAQTRPSGDLTGLDSDDIEIAARWSGEPGALMDALTRFRWIDVDQTTGEIALHDWADHQPFVSSFQERSEKATKAIRARWEKRGVRTSNRKRIRSVYDQNTEGNTPSLSLTKNTPPPPPLECQGGAEGEQGIAEKPADRERLIFDHWNGLKVVVHKEFDKFKPFIHARLEHYSPGEILEAMTNYAKVLASDRHWPTYAWTIEEFLSRKNGFDKYLSVNKPLENFRKRDGPGGGTNGTQERAAVPESHEGKRYIVLGGLVDKDGRRVMMTPETVCKKYGVDEAECFLAKSIDQLISKGVNIKAYTILKPRQDGEYALEEETT